MVHSPRTTVHSVELILTHRGSRRSDGSATSHVLLWTLVCGWWTTPVGLSVAGLQIRLGGALEMTRRPEVQAVRHVVRWVDHR